MRCCDHFAYFVTGMHMEKQTLIRLAPSTGHTLSLMGTRFGLDRIRHIQYFQGWLGPYIHTMYDRVYGCFPAKNTVITYA